MKLKLVTGIVSAAAIALIGLSNPAQANSPHGRGGYGLWMQRMQTLVEELDLTEAQQTQIEQIKQDTQADIQAVLTDEQEAQIRDALADGMLMQTMRELDLSPTQRSDIREILRSSWDEMSALLTPEQQQQVRQFMRNQRQENARPGQGQGRQGNRQERVRPEQGQAGQNSRRGGAQPDQAE
jgi:protein CpxP